MFYEVLLDLLFKSQASQDKFVYLLLCGLLKKNGPGYYLEIGAGHPIHINNSYFLEKALGWQGVSIDHSAEVTRSWCDVRKGRLIIADATQADYNSIRHCCVNRRICCE